jgi:hypothetical protein
MTPVFTFPPAIPAHAALHALFVIAAPEQAPCMLCAPCGWQRGQIQTLDSNFENSYLNIQSSKNYETSSVGFLIL